MGLILLQHLIILAGPMDK